MERICRTAFFKMVSHTLESRKKKCIEFLILHAVVLNGKSAGTFERYSIRRVRKNEISFGISHKSRYIFGRCSITAHQFVPADSPYISTLYKCCFFKCCCKVEIIVLNIIAAVCIKKVSYFFFIKSGKTKVKAEVLEFFHFNGKEFIVPASIQRHSIISENIRFLLSLCEMVGIHAGNFCNTFFLCRHNTSMTCKYIVILINDNRIYKTEFTQR